MFKWLKNWLKKLDEIQDKENFERYKQLIYDCWRRDVNKNLVNFSYEGYRIIFERLICEADHSIMIFCESYKKIFTPELFTLFELKVSSGIDTTIITYGENDNEIFDRLKEHQNFKHISVKAKYPDQCNDFIVVDEKAFWIENKKYSCRKDFTTPLFASCNFNDRIYALQLVKFVKDIKLENLKKVI